MEMPRSKYRYSKPMYVVMQANQVKQHIALRFEQKHLDICWFLFFNMCAVILYLKKEFVEKLYLFLKNLKKFMYFGEVIWRNHDF